MANVKGTPTEGNGGAGTSATITLPSNVAGDLLVFGLAVGANPTTTLAGWTKTQDTGGGVAGLSIFQKVAGASEPNPSVTWSNNRKWAYVCYAIENHDGVSDAATAIDDVVGDTIDAPSVVAVGADSLLLSFVSALGSPTVNSPTGMTDQFGDAAAAPQNVALITARQTVISGATGAKQWSNFSPDSRGAGGNIVIANLAGGSTVEGAVTESATLQDTPAATLEARASLSDQLSLQDTPAATLEARASLSSQLSLQDTPAATLVISASVSESIQLSNIITGAVGEPDLSLWEPVAGHIAYEFVEGATWTDVDVTGIGVTSLADFAPFIETHMDANQTARIRYIFPAGSYVLSSELRINRDFKRIIGAGSDLTVFNVDTVGKIIFAGFDGSTSNIVGSPSRGDTTVQVLDASIATVGETIAIKQTANDTVTCTDDNTSPYALGTIPVESFAEDPWMQIVEVTGVDTGTDIITFTPALALDYDSGQSPYAKDFNNVIDCGIEGVTINVTLDHGLTALEFDRCKNIKVYDVKIIDYAKFGLSFRECFGGEVSFCRFIGSRDQGTGGNGYSIHLELGTCKIHVHENAITGPYRHAISLETGASHNIIAYNYVAIASSEDLTDLSIHGHYTHHNLIEGNIFHGTVEVNDFYPQTLQNVLFRNKILGNANFWDSTSSTYSFWIRRNSLAAIVGNRCNTANVARVFDCSQDSLIELNGNSDAPAAWMGNSRYLSAKPATWGVSFTWPPFAGNADNPIPAESLVLGTLITASLAEGLTLQDAIARTATIGATTSETVAFQQTPDNVANIIAQISAGITVDDQYTKLATLSTAILEAYTAGDEWAVQLVANIAASTESLSLDDIITAIVDSPNSISAFLIDALGLSGAVTALLTGNATINEQLVVSEELSSILNANAIFSESLSLSDQGAGLLLALAALSESITFSDSFAAAILSLLTGQTIDTTAYLDTLTATLNAASSQNNVIGFLASTANNLNALAFNSETFVLSDSYTANSVLNAFLSQSISLTDSYSTSSPGFALGTILITARAIASSIQIGARSGGTTSINNE